MDLGQPDKVKRLQDASLALSGQILNKTMQDLKEDKITPLEATNILKGLGLSVNNFTNPHDYDRTDNADYINLND